MLLKILTVLFVLSQIADSQKCLRTSSKEGSVKDEPCIFPFVLNSIQHDACTSDNDPDGKFWCSTMVDANNNHIKGKWGYCDPGKRVSIPTCKNSILKVQPYSSLVEAEEGSYLCDKLQQLWNENKTKRLCRKGNNQICLTICLHIPLAVTLPRYCNVKHLLGNYFKRTD